jgi:hypothetical protein
MVRSVGTIAVWRVVYIYVGTFDFNAKRKPMLSIEKIVTIVTDIIMPYPHADFVNSASIERTGIAIVLLLNTFTYFQMA